ncbi:MAG: hypothetical protein EAZ65_00235 [Verrucomicrobia bacterium]|nr:MAG: hypothetical protein EAZ84_08955 [Verrucomicrobiota bacterium]TAE89353.1 MAG: hypothetical protein EAZ82_01660 [Verrucomicrobiota bacterium]TAF27771.1 MAG: hypothetical protein EAZ71_00240 [Verrucomicrobiota bacterium]TAF42620.1 MAG: hypothetical protein EAZ65_00235 [Verrucomicrobiota bacterium]
MDTLKILLGATVALLLGALAVSYQNSKHATAGDADKEKAEILLKIEELRLEQEKMKMDRERLAQEVASRPAAPAAEPSQIAALQQQIVDLQSEKEKAERDAETADREAAFVGGKMLEGRDQEARRARMIRDALLIARVKEWVVDPKHGNFATIEVLMPDNVQPGATLCIRRNTGILGRLKVGEISIEGAIANPLGEFSEAMPQAGDELILEPPF